MNKHYYLVIDTETANGMDDPLTYDIGFAIIDRSGTIYETYSFVVRDIFYDMSDVMQSAYYNKKIPRYIIDIENGSRTVLDFMQIWWCIRQLCHQYPIKAIIAHNARFDVRALNTTVRYLTKSKYRFFFPYKIEIWDTLRMARQIIGTQKRYKKFCEKNGYICKNGRVRLTAEILYRYITNDINFVESHTGLEDVLIEKEIFVKCIRAKKKMEKRAFVRK